MGKIEESLREVVLCNLKNGKRKRIWKASPQEGVVYTIPCRLEDSECRVGARQNGRWDGEIVEGQAKEAFKHQAGTGEP